MRNKFKTLSKVFALCTASVLLFSGVTSNASTNANSTFAETNNLSEKSDGDLLEGKHISVSLKADKTTGGVYNTTTLRYEGKRVVGTYVYPEQITYDIIVKNYGTEDLTNIKLTDTLSEELINAVDVNSIDFDLEKGYYVTTSDGENVSITVESDDSVVGDGSLNKEDLLGREVTEGDIKELNQTLIIDKLKSGDSIKLKLKMNAKQGVTSAANLKNSVTVQFDEGNNGTLLNSILNLFSNDSEFLSDEDFINVGEYVNVHPQMNVTMSLERENGGSAGDAAEDGPNTNNGPGTGVDIGTGTEAVYNAGDVVNFKINVVNSGDVTLYDVTLKDDVSAQLMSVLNQDYSFGKTATILDKNGNKHDSNLTVDGAVAILNKLDPGQTAEITFTGTIKADATEATNLLNRVTGTAKWLNSNANPAEYVQLTLDPEKHIAETFISVSGKPKMNILMTTNKTLENGNAVYNAGDVVEYKIVVNNVGGKDLVKVNVKDLPSDALIQACQDYSFVIDGNSFTTSLGNKVTVNAVSKTEVLIDSLKSGDSVTLYFDAILAEEVSGIENISNAANVTAFYDDLSNYPNSNLVQLPVDEKNHNSEVLISVLGQPSLGVKINAVTETGVNNFKPGDVISLNLQLENTGNYDLVSLTASCIMDDLLTQSTDFNTFYGSSILTTVNGNKLTVEEGIDSISLDKLAVGDSVTIPFTIRLKKEAEEASNLKLGIRIDPKYLLDGKECAFDSVEEFTTLNIVKDSEQTDLDQSGLVVALKADKTTNKVFNQETGRYDVQTADAANGAVEGAADGTSGGQADGVKSYTAKYKSGENIDYTITVTNTKEIDLYNVRLENSLSKELRNVLNDGGKFVLPETGVITSRNGSQIILGTSSVSSTNTGQVDESTPAFNITNNGSAAVLDENTQAITLSKLPANDAVEIHFVATISTTASKVDNALDTVQVTGELLNSSNVLEPIPVTDKMSDMESISISSLASLRLAKLADKTTGVELIDGRYQGTKVTAEYGPTSVIKYKLTVTNLGTTDAVNLVVTEQPSDQLKYLSEYGKFVTEGTVKTSLGNEAKVTVKGLSATVDKLVTNDSAELVFEVKLKADTMDALDIQNTASVTGNYAINSQQFEIPKTELMSDVDAISINKNVEPSGKETVTKKDGDNSGKKNGGDIDQKDKDQKNGNSDGVDGKNTKSTGVKTGDQNHVFLWLIVFASSILVAYKTFRRVRD